MNKSYWETKYFKTINRRQNIKTALSKYNYWHCIDKPDW